MEWLKESGSEFMVGVFVLILEKTVSPIWRHRHRIGQSRFVASVVGFYRRGSQRFRNVCLREWARFRDLPIVGQIGLSIFVAGCLPAVFWMSYKSRSLRRKCARCNNGSGGRGAGLLCSEL